MWIYTLYSTILNFLFNFMFGHPVVMCKIRQMEKTLNLNNSLDFRQFYCWLTIKCVNHNNSLNSKVTVSTIIVIDSPLHLSMFYKQITTVAIALGLQCMEAHINIWPGLQDHVGWHTQEFLWNFVYIFMLGPHLSL